MSRAGEVAAADPAWFFWPAFLATTLPAILIIAWVASRLLGVRRSVTATVLAGALGWLAAIMFALVITDIPFRQASRSEEFSNYVWPFSVVFTMLATAGLQLFAKPGALARVQSGLVSVPRPIRALRRKYRRLRRYTEITRIAARHRLSPWLNGSDRPRPPLPTAAPRRAGVSALPSRTEVECSSSWVSSCRPGPTSSLRASWPSSPTCATRRPRLTPRRCAACWRPSSEDR